MKLSKERRAELRALAENKPNTSEVVWIAHAVAAMPAALADLDELEEEIATDRIKVIEAMEAVKDERDNLRAKLADAVKALESIESLNDRNNVESVTIRLSPAHVSAWAAHELARRALAHLKA